MACTGPVRARLRGARLWMLAVTASLAGLVVALGGSAGASALPSNCTVVGVAVTCSFTYTGTEATWKVPAGVKSIYIRAAGGTGGFNGENDASGGYGGTVAASVAVTGGKTLYIDVGGNGSTSGAGGLSGSTPSGGDGGSNEGPGNVGGGGGGATAVQTCSANAASCVARYHGQHDPRLAIAGGGGGGGGYDGCAGGSGGGGFTLTGDSGCAYGGGGGNGSGGTGRWLSCESATFDGGGAGATQSAAGTAGHSDTGFPGSAGSGSRGGNGYPGGAAINGFGGGGGGGYYGGGGGGATSNCGAYGFGGGAGSSFAASKRVTYGNDATHTPSVTISYKLVTLSGLRVKPRSASIATGSVKLKVHFTLNTGVRVKFTVQRRKAGHLVRVRGKIVKRGKAGANKFVWNGMIGGHALAAGKYVLTASPSGGAPKATKFKLTG